MPSVPAFTNPMWGLQLIPKRAENPHRDAAMTVPDTVIGVFFICLLLSRPARVARSYLQAGLGGQSFCNCTRSLLVASVYSETCRVALFALAG